MALLRTADELRSTLPAMARPVLVPTMGALHAGHVELLRAARSAAGSGRPVVMTLFVNAAQFDDPSDFHRYPRDERRDAELAHAEGADHVFAPAYETVYPPDDPAAAPAIADADLPAVATEPGLEDAARPGHFAGVYRVCKRLFELTEPAAAVFGEKDWQQLQLVGAMVRREAMPIEIVPIATVREADGLAMSSRNARLSEGQRARASAMPHALEAARAERDPSAAEWAAQRVLEAAGLVVEYAAVRDAETLAGPPGPGRPGRVLVAASLPSTRLIDNASWPGE